MASRIGEGAATSGAGGETREQRDMRELVKPETMAAVRALCEAAVATDSIIYVDVGDDSSTISVVARAAVVVSLGTHGMPPPPFGQLCTHPGVSACWVVASRKRDQKAVSFRARVVDLSAPAGDA